MSYRHGKDCKVTLGTDTVVGMGTASISGITTDMADSTAFNDNWKSFLFGAKDGGTVTFNGLADPDDVTGQEVLQQAQINNTDIDNLRIYIDDTSYYTPCQTTGWLSPSLTSNQETVKSWVNVTSYSLNYDRSDNNKVSFECKISGCMVLV